MMLIVKMDVKKYFIAIVIPAPVFGRIEEIKQELFKQCNLKGALRSPSHITLHRPFEWKEAKEQELIEKLRAFEFGESFDIALKGFDFFEPRVIYINVVQQQLLYDLHEGLKRFAKKELGLLNEVNDLRGFHPHVTVAFRDLKKAVFYGLQENFKSRYFEGDFKYAGFSLLKFEKTWEELYFFKITAP
ncbi:MAG: 2'-5' RNA ligase family protein [Bacteroidota bacterium]